LELSARQLLRLTGDAIAVLQHDQVGLRCESVRRYQHECHCGQYTERLRAQTKRTSARFQKTIPSNFFNRSSNDIIVSASGAMGANVTTTKPSKASFVMGASRIDLTISKLFPRSARDWMSGLPSTGSLAVAPPRSHLTSNSRTYRPASVPYSSSPSRLA